MMRNCTDVAKEELEYFVEGFQLDPLSCVGYFTNPVYYWIGAKNVKLAELTRLMEIISEPSFLTEANNNQLAPTQNITIPQIDAADPPQSYNTICETIKMALD